MGGIREPGVDCCGTCTTKRSPGATPAGTLHVNLTPAGVNPTISAPSFVPSGTRTCMVKVVTGRVRRGREGGKGFGQECTSLFWHFHVSIQVRVRARARARASVCTRERERERREREREREMTRGVMGDWDKESRGREEKIWGEKVPMLRTREREWRKPSQCLLIAHCEAPLS